jgi:hypothetical protein
LGGGAFGVLMMLKRKWRGWGIIFFKSAKGCKRLQVNAIDCKMCRENQEALAQAFGATFEALHG